MDAAATAAATASRSAASAKLAEDDVRGAALHCVALEEAGEFPTNRVLGLFEVAPLQQGPPPVGKLGISSAEVELVVRRRHEDENLHDNVDGGVGGGADGSDAAPGTIGIEVLLEVTLGGGVSASSFLGQDVTEKAAEEGNATESGRETGGRPPSSAGGGGRGGKGGSGRAEFGLTFGASDAYHVPTRGDVETAAAAAVAAVTDPADSQAAISALACWNLMMTRWEVDAPAVHVEVVVAVGSRGEWYTTKKTIALTRSAIQAASAEPGEPPPLFSSGSSSPGDSGNHGTARLIASFDWQPAADIWAQLGGPAVADVKVYDAADEDVAGGTSAAGLSSSPSVRPLLQATLCKRAVAGGGVGGGGAATGVTAVRTYVTPYTEQQVNARRTAHDSNSSGIGGGGIYDRSSNSSTGSNGCVQTQPEFSSVGLDDSAAGIGFATSPPWVVSEIEDREWWTKHEREEWSKGMDAVHALPRLRGWKPEDWRKRQQRRKKQAREKERRRSEEAANRRENARAKRGHDSRPTDCSGRNSVWGVVKGAWRAAGREWRKARRIFGGRSKK